MSGAPGPAQLEVSDARAEDSGASAASRPASARREHLPALLLCLILPLFDLVWNLTHLNIGLEDFYGLASFAQAAGQGHWPANAYFPAGYPLLLTPWGLLGAAVQGQGLLGQGVLLGGYVYSALGIGLALAALYRLSLLLGLGRWLALLILVLGWLSSPVRVIAGSPSVDALYTGLGLWFVVGSIWLWMGQRGDVLQRWRSYTPVPFALLAAGALFTLRSHTKVLVIPIAVMVYFWGQLGVLFKASRRLGWIFMISGLFVLSGFPFWGPRGSSEVAELQVRSGLEMRYHKAYANNEALWDDYANFAEKSRAASLLADYSSSEIATHVLSNWWDFLRRTPILLAVVLWPLCLLARRRFPPGASILTLWVVLYSLALSPAYYTERAAALPLLVALPLVPLLGRTLIDKDGRRGRLPLRESEAQAEQSEGPVMLLIMLLLVLGLAWQGKTAWQDFQTRSYYANASRLLDAELQKRGIARDAVMVIDWRLLPLSSNPWCEPYRNVYGSWLDDPAIPAELRAGIPPRLGNRTKVSDLVKMESRGITHFVMLDWPSEEQIAAMGHDFEVTVEKVDPLFLFLRAVIPGKAVAVAAVDSNRL